MSSRATAVLAGRAWRSGRLERDVLLEIGEGGRITSIGQRDGRPLPDGALDLSRRLVLPGTCNTHSHAFQVLLRGRCERAASFHDWVSRYLYPLVASLDVDSVRAASRLAFLDMAMNGVTTVGEFHYVHRGPGGKDAGNEYSHAVIDAAEDVGIRIAFLRAFYDQPGPPGRERFLEQPGISLARIGEVERDVAGRERVTVGAAPHSLHGASREAFTAARDWTRERGAVLHTHLAEQRSDLETARQRHGRTPLRVLESFGVVDRRLSVVHGCWLDREELAALGRAGGSLVSCPGSNMALGDGVADLVTARGCGVRVALGADGACANNSLDMYREARAAEHLQRVTKLRMGVLTAEGGAASVLDMASVNGMRSLGLPGGRLEVGQLADLVAIDPDDPSIQPWTDPDDPAEAAELLAAHAGFGMSPRGAVTDVVVGGRPIVRERRPVLVDATEVARSVRALPQARQARA